MPENHTKFVTTVPGEPLSYGQGVLSGVSLRKSGTKPLNPLADRTILLSRRAG